MRRTRRVKTAVIALTASALLASANGSAQAEEPQFSAGARLPDVTVDRNTTEPGSVRDFWTPERIAKAKANPADVGVAHLPPVNALKTAPPSKPWPDVSVSADPVPPKNPALLPKKGIQAAPSAEEGELTQSVGTPYPDRWPWILTGLLLFEHADGGLYQCSASVIVHDNRSTLWTAAHCLHTGKNGGGWHKNAIFAPGFDGSAPIDFWEKSQSIVTTSWAEETDYRYSDMGAMVLKPHPDYGYIQDVVGAYGFEFRSNSPGNDAVFSIGYPADGYNRPDSDFTGDHQMYCYGNTVDASDFNPLDDRLQMDCDMGNGSSGGPMVKNLTTSPQIVGNNSHRYTDDSGEWADIHLFSSEHGPQAVAVYEAVN